MAGTRTMKHHPNNTIKVGGKIILTNHCIEQYALRMRLSIVEKAKSTNNNTQSTKERIKEVVTNEIRHSNLLSMKNGQERRIYKGNKYVTKYDPMRNETVIITMLITEVTQKELFSNKFYEDVDQSQFRALPLAQ